MLLLLLLAVHTHSDITHRLLRDISRVSLYLYKNLRVDHSTGDHVIGGRGTSAADVRGDWQQAVAVANVRPAYSMLGRQSPSGEWS